MQTPIQSSLDTLLCILSYPTQCLIADQLSDAAESNRLTPETQAEVKSILYYLKHHGMFHYRTAEAYPHIEKAPRDLY